MNRIDFRNGHHLDIETMNFLQDAYIKPMSAFFGRAKCKNFFVSGGSLVSGSSLSDGYVVLNGEFMEFRGGEFSETNIYVVKRTETRTNVNADGQEYQSLITSYATIGPNETGAVPLIDMIPCRMIPLVSSDGADGDINTRWPVTSDEQAYSMEILDMERAKLRYIVSNDNHLLIYGGIFIPQDERTQEAYNNLAVIPNWKFGAVYNIPCRVWATRRTGEALLAHASVSIDAQGVMSLNSPTGNSHIAGFMFDGAPIWMGSYNLCDL